MGMDGMGWDLCAGLLYEHRFAMLIKGREYTGASLHQDFKSKSTQIKFDQLCSESSAMIWIELSYQVWHFSPLVSQCKVLNTIWCFTPLNTWEPCAPHKEGSKRQLATLRAGSRPPTVHFWQGFWQPQTNLAKLSFSTAKFSGRSSFISGKVHFKKTWTF